MDIPNDQLLAAYARIPRPIREFLTNSELGPIASALAQKHGLHIDSTGILVDIVTKTLLGFVRPDDLPKTLAEQLHLEGAVSGALISDINNEVFVVLQQRVREASEAEARERAFEQELRDSAPPDEALALEEPVIDVPIPTPALKPEPLAPPSIEYTPAYPTLPGSPIPAPMPIPGVVEAAHLPATIAAVQSQPIVPQQQFMHTMPNVAPQQGWHPAAAVHIFVPTHANAPATPPAEHRTIDAVSLHIAEPSVPSAQPVAPVRTVPGAVIAPSAPLPQPAPATPIAKEYAADPYREPV